MKVVRNIVFDMGGVLIDLDCDACVTRFAELGYARADQLLNSYRQEGIFARLELGTINRVELYESIRKDAGRFIAPEDIDDALCRFLKGIPSYKLDLLLRLRERFRLYMLSNTNHIMFEYASRKFFRYKGYEVHDFFDMLFLSCDMHIMKPDEEIFLRMCEIAAIDPAETLFVDDGEQNVQAAAALGFQTYLAGQQEDFSHIFDSM